MYVIISGSTPGLATLTSLDDSGVADPDDPPQLLAGDDLVEAVEALELENPRWVWADTAFHYGWLLAHGVRVDRCHDLRLTRAILRASALSAGSTLAASPRGEWDGPAPALGTDDPVSAAAAAREPSAGPVPFEFDAPVMARSAGEAAAPSTDASVGEEALAARTLAELALQLDAIRTATEPNRLRLLVAAESAGALVAAEMSHAGLPWREDLHDRLLTELLGPRVAAGQRPERLDELAGAVRRALDAPHLNPDSPQELLRALQGAGLGVTTTRSWELQGIDHPVVAPLLEYKKLVRLLTANGWSWMESWVTDGRFFPDYVPGGVVSGRWATRGGGALQLPKQVRRAVTADDGWTLVVADAAQLEPRILAGISADTVMADAGRGTDLYAGIVSSGAVKTRAEAKVAMLGAMYGATSGESGRLLPRLGRAFPTALAYVENAARAGERGEVVTSRLGRSAPRPGEQWFELQAAAREGTPDERLQQQARREARDWGRFTRNFVVQSSAADWALCWMADLRRRLAALAPADPDVGLDLDTDALDRSALGGSPFGGNAVDGSVLNGDARDGGADHDALATAAHGPRTATTRPRPDAADARPSAATVEAAALAATTAHVTTRAEATAGADSTAAGADGATEAQVTARAASAEAGVTPGADGTAEAVVTRGADGATEATAGTDGTAELSPADREAARVAAIEAEIAERERRKAADSPFKAADPVAAMAARLAELQSAGRSVRPVATPAVPTASPTRPATTAPSHPAIPAPAVAASPDAARTANTPPAAPGAMFGIGEAGTPTDASSAVIVAGRAREPFARAPHLVFFLHDEVIVHAPAALAEQVAEAIRESAAAATRLLFGRFPLDVPLDISIVDSYADAD